VKIGLIAMSGVRACDPKLLELGLTLPGFLERGRTIASLPSLGLLTLAGLTPAEHRCEYFEVADLRKLPSIPNGFDLVAISSFSAQIDEAYELADRYRAAGTPVVLGGLHVTSLPDEAARHADAVVVGEAEPVWRQLLCDAEAGCLQPRYCAESDFCLDDAPLPAFELLDPEHYNRLTVQTSRGCPFRCEFCAGSILLTRRYKQKPIAKVLDEIDRIRAIWRRPFIEFADDNSFVNRRYWKELLTELKSRRIRWFTECDLSVYRDAELLRLMRESGCAEVLIGFESPVETGLAGLELNSNWKWKRWREYKRVIARIQSRGIRVNGCFILGLDGHTPEIFDDVYDFAVDSELFDIQITIQTPFPGTPLYDRLKRESRLHHEGDWRRCTLFDVNYDPRGMTSDELRDGFRSLVERLYSEPVTRARRDNFQRKYLRT
jgi:radical SAM superfamily enzyme YgiQ (UPF0313 family)